MCASDGTTPGTIPGIDGMGPITVSAGVHGTAGAGAGVIITPDGAMAGDPAGTTDGCPLPIGPIGRAEARSPIVATVQGRALQEAAV